MMVRPTGQPLNDKVGKWAAAEMQHAIDHWRRQFRGEARVKDDQDINDADIAAHNLDPLGRPERATPSWPRSPTSCRSSGASDGVRARDERTYAAGHHVPVLIYPNPLNPKRYVVLNSGFTFREYDYLNNARQVPKLPDYAVIDVDVPVLSRTPGGIVTAGFFTEEWAMPVAR